MDRFIQAQHYHQAGRFHEAKQSYEACVRESPLHSDAWHGLALLHTQLSEYDEAIIYLQKAIASAPDNPLLHNHLGNLLKKCARREEALAAFEEALRLKPDFSDAMNNLGNLYFANAAYERALDYYTKALTHDLRHDKARYNQGLCQLKLGYTEAAIATFTALCTDHPSHQGAHYHLGIIKFTAGDFAAALTHFHAVLIEDPDHLEMHINSGHAYLSLHDLTKALWHYEAALVIDNTSTEAHYNLACIAEQKNNLDLAIQHYLQVVRLDPHHFAAHNNVGVAFIKKNAKSFALKHLLQAQRLEPDHTSLNYTIDALQASKTPESAPSCYIKELFDHYARDFDTQVILGLEYRGHLECYQALKKTMRLPQNTWTLVDLGCGTGLCGPLLRPHAKTLIGVDLSPNMLEKARQKNSYDTLIEADLNDYLASTPLLCDGFIAADVLVYTGNLHPLLQKIFVALKGNGFFVFSTEVSGDVDFCITPSGRYAHSRAYLTRLAEQTGFVIRDMAVQSTRLQFEKTVPGWIVVLQKPSV